MINMNIKSWVIFIALLVFSISSCSNENDNRIKKYLENIPIENAEWVYFSITPSFQVEKTGKYTNGRKTGKWLYSIPEEEEKNILWQFHASEKVSLNYPYYLKKEDESDRSIFFAINADSTSYLVILERSPEDTSSLQYFSELYNYSISDDDEELYFVDAKLLTKRNGENQVFYHFEYSNKEIRSIALGMIISSNGKIYDVAFRTEKYTESDTFWQMVKFTDIINSMFINGRRVVVPLEDYENIAEIDLE